MYYILTQSEANEVIGNAGGYDITLADYYDYINMNYEVIS